MMRGLLDNVGPGAGQPQPGGPAQQPQPAAGPQGVAPEVGFQGEANVSPEEQAAYDQFMDNAFKVIYDDKAAKQILGRIGQSGNPIEGLATVTVQIVTRLADDARKQGNPVDPAILLHGGADIMSDIAELAGKAGVHNFTEEEIENSMYVAMDQYGTAEMEKGTLDKEAIKSDFQQMMEADKAGRIDELIPGLTEKANQIKAKGKPNAKT